MDEKETLQRYLSKQRADLLGKLDGLGEYDIRRPLVPSGTNLLGLVKHVASVQLGYLGEVMGRPADRDVPWLSETSEPEADLWATADETKEAVVEFARYSATHADATVDALDLDSPSLVPWWPEGRRDVTLHSILVHLCVETARHAGHADLLRELVDGRLGNGAGDPNVPERDGAGWRSHHDRVEAAALAASGRASG
ncbi:DinB family protein [Frigoribacterium sp. CFBP9030]|uniref:DinB family protein n=1 Tax=Frigoribacterium sp. CFBP9030 TaxID=3096537 RepID=UPI002A6AD197|nr:DinB family protein [Frigoribacterium sp. CFBP9030]MDY0891668.1 DinB family protein [Frigoribacterium sp. CFBP9030]